MPPARVPPPDSYDQHPFIPGKRLHDLPHVREALHKLIDHHKAAKLKHSDKQPQKKEDEPLDTRGLALLQHAAANLWMPTVWLWKMMMPEPLHYTVQGRIHEQLQKAGLAEFKLIQLGKPRYVLIRLTEAGWRYLQLDVPKHRGRGDIVHLHLMYWIVMKLVKQGRKAELEWRVPGTNHPADVASPRPDGLHDVWEVVSTAKNNLVDHIHACFAQSTAVAQMHIVVTQKKEIKPLRKRLESELAISPYMDRVVFEPILPYLLEAMAK